MKRKHRSTPTGGQDYYKHLLQDCQQPELEEEDSEDYKPKAPLIIERDGRKLIYNGHMGTFVEYHGNE